MSPSGWDTGPGSIRSFRVGFIPAQPKTSACLDIVLSPNHCGRVRIRVGSGRPRLYRPAAVQFGRAGGESAIAGFACLGPVAGRFPVLGWLVLSIGIIGQLLFRFTVGPLLHRQPEGDTLAQLFAGSMFHFGTAITWLGARAWARRYRPAAIRPYAPVTIDGAQQSLRGGLLTFLALMPLATGAGLLWERLLQSMGLPTERQEIVDLILKSKSPALLGFLIALALVVAPVCEELVFRVGIFRFLRTRAPAGWHLGSAPVCSRSCTATG